MDEVGASVLMHMGTYVLSVQVLFVPGLVLNFHTVAVHAVVWVKGVYTDLTSSNQFTVVAAFFLLPFLSVRTDLLKLFPVNRLHI